MLTPRIIPVLQLYNNRLTKTIQFQIQNSGIRRDVGDPVQQAKVYEAQLADELVLLDIRAMIEGRGTEYLLEWTKRIAEEVTIPLTVGGGIRTVEQARGLIRNGAEKVVVGTSAHGTGLINAIGRELGTQSVVVALDIRRIKGEGHRAYIASGTIKVYGSARNIARAIEGAGAGEILLTSIDREGMMQGYDLELVEDISRAVNIPVVANGGAGKAQDMVEAIKAGASGVAASSLFCFTDISVIKVKAVFERMGETVRR